MTRQLRMPILALTSLLLCTHAWSATDPADLCEASKLAEVGKLTSCTMKVLSKASRADEPADEGSLQTCEDKFTAKITAAETKAAGACPSAGDAAELAGEVAGLVARIADNVSGARFIDNGDGTVTDTEQGVVWQQQVAGSDCDNCVDAARTVGNTFLWLGSLSSGDTPLGGSRAWGLPSIEELQSIVSCAELPCTFVDPILGPSPTPSAGGSTYIVSGTVDVSTIPCVKVLRLEDGSVVCQDPPSVNGSSRARIMNNAR